MRFLSVRVQMWQAQEKDSERRKRRKEELPEDSYLGHAVKNCMTVISKDGELSDIYGKYTGSVGRFFIPASNEPSDCAQAFGGCQRESDFQIKSSKVPEGGSYVDFYRCRRCHRDAV